MDTFLENYKFPKMKQWKPVYVVILIDVCT